MAKITPEAIDASEELVEVFIPKVSRTDAQRFISVNGERILVQTGVKVKIKRKFAEVIDNSLAADNEAAAYIEANANG